MVCFHSVQFPPFSFSTGLSFKRLGRYSWATRYDTVAMLVVVNKRYYISFFCSHHQHGRCVFVFESTGIGCNLSIQAVDCYPYRTSIDLNADVNDQPGRGLAVATSVLS